jgi:prepilin-type processing-associated H-X9-DG protein
VPRGHDFRRPVAFPQWNALIAKSMGIRTPFTWEDVARFPQLHCPSHPTVDPTPTSHYVINSFGFKTAPDYLRVGPSRWNRLATQPKLPWLLETQPLFGGEPFLPNDGIFNEETHQVFRPEHISAENADTGLRVGRDNHGKGRSNVLFADGHVETLSTSQIPLAQFDDGVRD